MDVCVCGGGGGGGNNCLSDLSFNLGMDERGKRKPE